MRILSVLAGIALTASIVSAKEQPKPTVKLCREDAGLWVRQLNEHRNTVANTQSQQFSTVAGKVSTYDWFSRQDELIACILTVDRRRTEAYKSTLRRIDSLISLRYEGFLLATEQMQAFGQWEREQQQASSPAPAPHSEEPTVASNR
jgi:hypothetical protein